MTFISETILTIPINLYYHRLLLYETSRASLPHLCRSFCRSPFLEGVKDAVSFMVAHSRLRTIGTTLVDC